MKEDWREHWEVWEGGAVKTFTTEASARQAYTQLLAAGATDLHLHVNAELWVDGEPTGEFGEEDCMERSYDNEWEDIR